MLKSIIFSVATIGFAPIYAEDVPEPEPEKLTSLRAAWKAATERDARPIKDKYLTALIKLRKQLTQQEKLGDAVLVRDEIDVLTQGVKPVKPAEDESAGLTQLVSLRATYERETNRMIESNDKKYVAALKAMQRAFSKKGELESALAVKTELDKFTDAPPDDEPDKQVPFKKWIKTVKFHLVGGEYRFVDRDNMVSRDEDGKPRPGLENSGRITEIDSDKQTIFWQYVRSGRSSLTIDADRKGGTLIRVAGARERFTVVPRMKKR